MATDTRIDDLNEILDDGVKKTTVNAETVEYDHKSARQRRRELIEKDSESKTTRPRTGRTKRGGSL
jgi:hypothetical protein